MDSENDSRIHQRISYDEMEIRSFMSMSSAIWMSSSRRIVPSHTNSEINDDNDMTCCRRATWCEPKLRDILVTEPVFKSCYKKFTYGTAFWLVTITAISTMSYTMAYLYIGDSMLPGGALFGFLFVIIFAYFLGWSLAYIPYLHLPPIFGMLLAGIIICNAGWYDLHEELSSNVKTNIRTFSLTFVMLRAGLQLTSSGLREHPLFLLNLAIVPCTVELLTMAFCCRIILGYPWTWSLLTGSIIACMSPVVPINCILALAERGYGEDKDIATLLFAAASIDDIHIMSMYSIYYGSVFSKEHINTEWWSYIPGGLRDFFVGSIVGIILGIFFVFFPHRKQQHVLPYRISCLILGSLMCTTAISKLKITGGAFLATIIMSFTATTGWRILSTPFDLEPLREPVHLIWHYMQPVLIGIIAADLDFSNWPLHKTGLYLLCIVIGLIIRCIFAFLATLYTPFNLKERAFIALSWVAKGTIQAVLSSMVLEEAELSKEPIKLQFALEIAHISLLSIVVFSPLGALVMMATGPSLLSKTDVEVQRRRRELSYLRIVSLQPVRKRRL